MKNSVVLVGMMGSGKSAVGEKLAKALSLPFCDSDSMIEAEVNARIADIFTYQGEAYFRSKELEVIKKALKNGSVVLSCGGGAFCNAEIRNLCKEFGTSIYLQTPIEVLWDRVKDSDRPLARNGFEAFHALLQNRQQDYEQADIIIACHGKNESEIAEEIIKQLI